MRRLRNKDFRLMSFSVGALRGKSLHALLSLKTIDFSARFSSIWLMVPKDSHFPYQNKFLCIFKGCIQTRGCQPATWRPGRQLGCPQGHRSQEECGLCSLRSSFLLLLSYFIYLCSEKQPFAVMSFRIAFSHYLTFG